MEKFPHPPFPRQTQEMPGTTDRMQPLPDHGENSYQGSGRLKDKRAIITGGDSGIGRAVAIAYAREGADVLISYLSEHDDAMATKALVEEAGRKAVLAAGDIQSSDHCRRIVETAVRELGGIDILVNNAPIRRLQEHRRHQRRGVGADIPRQHARHVLPDQGSSAAHEEGSAIINTASINADVPNPILLAYATTKGAIHNFSAGLAQMLAERGIRVNVVAPGPIWTPLIPSTMPEDTVANFGKQVPMKRPGQPVELASAYVMLADPMSSYVSGATIAVTGGKPFL